MTRSFISQEPFVEFPYTRFPIREALRSGDQFTRCEQKLFANPRLRPYFTL